MASGPLVFISPVIDEGVSTSNKSGIADGVGSGDDDGGGKTVLRDIDNDCFYWNAITTSTASSTSPKTGRLTSPMLTSSKPIEEIRTTYDHLLTADWMNTRLHCGHSDPNIRKNLNKDLSFNNYTFGSTNLGIPTTTKMSGSSNKPVSTDWVIPGNLSAVSCNSIKQEVTDVEFGFPFGRLSSKSWQMRLNNNTESPSLEFFEQHSNKSPRSHTIFANSHDSDIDENVFYSSQFTTIVNNRSGFLQNNLFNPDYSFLQVDGEFAEVSGKEGSTGRIDSQLPGGNGTAATACGGDGSNSTTTTATNRQIVNTNMAVAMTNLSTTQASMRPENDLVKLIRPSSDTNVISLTDNPGAPMLVKTDSALSLDTESEARACCFCWCCCCSCSCIRMQALLDDVKHSNESVDDQHRTETQLLEPRSCFDDIKSWSESFDNLMNCFNSPDGALGQQAFREFLRSEYSEENIMFWLACEDLKLETLPHEIYEKAHSIYDDFISILSPKQQVSLDSRVHDMINVNITEPTPHTFDEAQLQIYTLMHRDSYPRFLNSRIYKDLLAMAKRENV